MPVILDGQRFGFNVELDVDAYSGGFVGLSIRDEEDSAAVTEALADGIATTGEAPLALLLDNKPSNHTDEVDAALDDVTLRIRATQGRPQNKAHVEGAFGLFQRSIPALDLHTNNPHDLARQVLGFVVQTCARIYNHRPRADRGGRSRVELYNEPITAEQIDKARAALEERRKKQERARTTLAARQDPIVRALLDDAFARLALLDPEGHIRVAIARYPLDVVVDGIAIFEAKRRVGTLPAGVDARYLLGIVRNIAATSARASPLADELLRELASTRATACSRPSVLARDAARVELPDVRRRVLALRRRARRPRPTATRRGPSGSTPSSRRSSPSLPKIESASTVTRRGSSRPRTPSHPASATTPSDTSATSSSRSNSPRSATWKVSDKPG